MLSKIKKYFFNLKKLNRTSVQSDNNKNDIDVERLMEQARVSVNIIGEPVKFKFIIPISGLKENEVKDFTTRLSKK